jgi:hypothetical protein
MRDPPAIRDAWSVGQNNKGISAHIAVVSLMLINEAWGNRQAPNLLADWMKSYLHDFHDSMAICKDVYFSFNSEKSEMADVLRREIQTVNDWFSELIHGEKKSGRCASPFLRAELLTPSITKRIYSASN